MHYANCSFVNYPLGEILAELQGPRLILSRGLAPSGGHVIPGLVVAPFFHKADISGVVVFHHRDGQTGRE